MKDITTIYYTVARPKKAPMYTYYTKECAPKGAKRLLSYGGKTIKVNQPDGSIKIGYMYGEKTYSYNLEEVERYRAERKAEREKMAERRYLLDKIYEEYEKMETEELKKIVEKISNKGWQTP